MTIKINKEHADNNTKKLKKTIYTSYSKLSEVKLITIGLASAERIKQWAEKTLPSGKILGEVTNANTLHHKTFKPQKGGLFCERIFGPLKDFECACGKPLKLKKEDKFMSNKQNVSNILSNYRKKDINQNNIGAADAGSTFPAEKTMQAEQLPKNFINLNKSILGQMDISSKSKNFCNNCEVEYTWSVIRRYQLGYIKLISPVTHVWYLKGNPSYLSILLDMKKRHLEYITYCSETLTLEHGLKGGIVSSKSSDIVSSWKKLKLKIKSQQENTSNTKTIGGLSPFETTKVSSNFNFYKNQSRLIGNNNAKDRFNENISIKNDDLSARAFENSKFIYTLSNLQKIEKRKNLKRYLKKHEFWKQFYNNSPIFSSNDMVNNPKKSRSVPAKTLKVINSININEDASWSTFLEDPIMQIGTILKYNNNKKNLEAISTSKSPGGLESVNINFNEINISKPTLNKYLIKYSQKIHNRLKYLKYLSFLIIQAKQSKLKISQTISLNNKGLGTEPRSCDLQIFPIKNIFKKISISSYILLNLNIFSKNLIQKNLTDLVWKKVSQEAYIKAFSRGNKLLNRLDLTYYNKIFLSFKKNERITSNHNDHKKNKNTINKLFNQAAIIDNSYSKENIFINNPLKILFKKIKNNVYTILNSYIFNELDTIINYPFKNKKLDSFKINTMELYTLSNFPSSFSNFLISNFLLDKIFMSAKIKKLIMDTSEATESYNLNRTTHKNSKVKINFKSMEGVSINLKTIIEDLTSIYLKILLKNKNFKDNIWLRSTKLKNLSKTDKYVFFPDKNTYKVNQLKKIKNSLIKFYLIGNFNLLYEQLVYSFKRKKLNKNNLILPSNRASSYDSGRLYINQKINNNPKKERSAKSILDDKMSISSWLSTNSKENFEGNLGEYSNNSVELLFINQFLFNIRIYIYIYIQSYLLLSFFHLI